MTAVTSSTGSTQESRLKAPLIKVAKPEDYADASLLREFGRKLKFTTPNEPAFTGGSTVEDLAVLALKE